MAYRCIGSMVAMFEEIIDAPMGRKLANAACDEEELLLNSGVLDHTGFFRKKKITQALEEMENTRLGNTKYQITKF